MGVMQLIRWFCCLCSSGNAAQGHKAEASMETAAVWAAEVENRVNGAAVFPVYMSSTFSYRCCLLCQMSCRTFVAAAQPENDD